MSISCNCWVYWWFNSSTCMRSPSNNLSTSSSSHSSRRSFSSLCSSSKRSSVELRHILIFIFYVQAVIRWFKFDHFLGNIINFFSGTQLIFGVIWNLKLLKQWLQSARSKNCTNHNLWFISQAVCITQSHFFSQYHSVKISDI